MINRILLLGYIKQKIKEVLENFFKSLSVFLLGGNSVLKAKGLKLPFSYGSLALDAKILAVIIVPLQRFSGGL